MPSEPQYEIPVAHINDPESVARLVQSLKEVHGAAFDFAVSRWDGPTTLGAPAGRTAYRFVVECRNATLALSPGDWVRAADPPGPYRAVDELLVVVTDTHEEAVWPGDAIVTHAALGGAHLDGRGTVLEVVADSSGYPAPKLALLRHLPDRPGGCASYPGAFRRETLPPVRPAESGADRVGVNRVNEHTLDMRPDRTPPPTMHHHGTVAGANGVVLNHSETAVVLPRSAYGLPEVATSRDGYAIIYRNPHLGTGDSFRVPVRPGSIVTTTATADAVYGHCFRNAFAMLVAVPGFIAPYEMIEER